MKILQYFEKAWLVAAAVAVVVAAYNLISLRVFDNHVYFPILCAMFCVLIWYNLRGQRRFRQKITDENRQKNKSEQ